MGGCIAEAAEAAAAPRSAHVSNLPPSFRGGILLIHVSAVRIWRCPIPRNIVINESLSRAQRRAWALLGSNLTSMTYPDGYVLTYGYGNAADGAVGRPTTITESSSGAQLASFVYLGLSTQVLGQTDAQAGITLAVTLNQFGQVAQDAWTGPNNANLVTNQYLYDNNGNVLYDAVSGGPTNAAAAIAALGGAYGYNNLNQNTVYERGTVSASGTGSIGGMSVDQIYSWSPQGQLLTETLAGQSSPIYTSPASGLGQSADNNYNAGGNAATSTNAAGDTVTTVFDAWGRPVSYTLTQTGSDGTVAQVGAESIQYDALGRVLSTYSTYALPDYMTSNAATSQQVVAYDAAGNRIETFNATLSNGASADVTLTAYERYVLGPNGQIILRDRSTAGNGTLNERMYALATPDGSVVAIANASGQVVERYVYDGLGNAQALDANGAPYAADANPGAGTGTGAQQIAEYLIGSVIPSYNNQTADGTQFDWTTLYHGQRYDGITGTYGAGAQTFNPRQQSLLTPDLGAIQAGISAYDPTGGATGVNGFVDRNVGLIAGGAEIGLGIAAGVATGGLADAGIAAAFGTQLGFWGGLGAASAAGAVSGFAANAAVAGLEGQGLGGSLEAGAWGGLGGAIGGAAFSGISAGLAAWQGAVDAGAGAVPAAGAAFGQSYATTEEWGALLADRYGAENVTGGAATALRNQIYGNLLANQFAMAGANLDSLAATEAVAQADAGATAITTPYGVEAQDASAEAQLARAQAESGASLYRTGQLGKSMGAESQYWSLQNPPAPGYAGQMGLPSVTPDFIMGGTLQPDASVVTNGAVGLGANAGGGIQVVTEPGAVRTDFFYMPD